MVRQQTGEGFGGCLITMANTSRGERATGERLFDRLERTNLGGKRADTTGERAACAGREEDALVHAASVAKNRGTGRLQHPGETQLGKYTRGGGEQTTVAERLAGAEKRVIPAPASRLGGGVGGIAPTTGRGQTGTEPGG